METCSRGGKQSAVPLRRRQTRVWKGGTPDVFDMPAVMIQYHTATTQSFWNNKRIVEWIFFSVWKPPRGLIWIWRVLQIRRLLCPGDLSQLIEHRGNKQKVRNCPSGSSESKICIKTWRIEAVKESKISCFLWFYRFFHRFIWLISLWCFSLNITAILSSQNAAANHRRDLRGDPGKFINEALMKTRHADSLCC